MLVKIPLKLTDQIIITLDKELVYHLLSHQYGKKDMGKIRKKEWRSVLILGFIFIHRTASLLNSSFAPGPALP